MAAKLREYSNGTKILILSYMKKDGGVSDVAVDMGRS